MENTLVTPPHLHVAPKITNTEYMDPPSTPLSHIPPVPLKYQRRSFTQDLFGNDEFGESNFRLPSNCPGTGSEWESFTSHFTEEFEMLKGELDNLRSEVKKS